MCKSHTCHRCDFGSSFTFTPLRSQCCKTVYSGTGCTTQCAILEVLLCIIPPQADSLLRYGQTKLEGEQAVLNVASKANAKNKVVILRVPVLYGSCDEPKDSAVNVLMSQLWSAQQIEEGKPKIQVDDYALRYPTNTQDVGRVCRDVAKLYLDPSNA
jgi:nucleoside-diphosphate-sugar epimerase